jgi:hypothetical protein
MNEPPICIKIICDTLRCIFITTTTKWKIITERLKKFDPNEELYLEGEFKPVISDILKAEILKDKNSLEAYRYLFDNKVWIGLDMMYLLDQALQILEFNEDLPEGEINPLAPRSKPAAAGRV